MITKRAMKKRAFTLIELLVVLAITSVILGIIMYPVVQSFNFTRSAQGFAEAQQQGRRVIERIAGEVSNSAGVRDNDGLKGAVAVVVPGQNNALETVLLEWAKLDILKPAQGDPSNIRDGAFVDPETGIADPTRRGPVGQVILPVAPGQTVVRYFIGLREPLAPNGLDPANYNNPHDGLLMNRNANRDNLYVLWRAEVQPVIYVNGAWVVNSAFFEDADADGKPDMDDPYFFVQDPPGQPVPPPAARQAKANRIKSWLRASTLVTEFSRYDMIRPIYNTTTQVVAYDGNVPRIMGLIQFRPTAVTSEPAQALMALRLGEETDNPSAVAPDVYQTEMGHWSSSVLRAYPSTYDPNTAGNNQYLICRFDARAGAREGRLYIYDPDADPDGDDLNGEDNPNDDMEIFDLKTYQQWVDQSSIYPFTRAVAAADSRSGWLSVPAARSLFLPMAADFARGKVALSFGIDEVGIDDPTGTQPPRPDNNLPNKATGPALTPVNDPATGGNFYDPAYSTINKLFNKVWADHPELRGPFIHRFIDLRVTPNADGTFGPLHPDPTVGFPQTIIVPGSETVMGPDQRPGPNYGNLIRYSRTTNEPGMNQYRINYTNLPEPDYAALGLTPPPASYSPTDFTSAVIQPRFKTGYIQLNSDPGVPLPDGVISVYYKFQLNGPQDSIAVDYDTRQVMSILVTIRNFPGTAQPNPQTITLKATAPIRNYVR